MTCSHRLLSECKARDQYWSNEKERSELLTHLVSCPKCRSWALAFEPALLAAAIPPLETSAEEVQSMIETVRALRRTDKLGLSERRRGFRARHVAAAGILLMTLLAIGGSHPGRGQDASVSGLRSMAAPRTQSIWSTSFARGDLLTLNTPRTSMSGDTKVYQVRTDDLSLVMIVDAALDL